MAVGIIFLSAAAVLLVYNNIDDNNAREQAAAIVPSLISIIEQNSEKAYEEDPFDTEMKTVEIDGYDYIGYIAIPKLELDLPVMSDWDYTRLKISPCRYYGSTKTHNLVIAAHNYKSHFCYLDGLEQNDSVFFTDMDGKTHTYKVTAVEILQPTDVERVKDTGDDLILYTCTYSRTERIVVRCVRTLVTSSNSRN